MARLARLAIDQQLHHLRHDAVDGRAIFGAPADRDDYRAALLEVSRQAEIAIHAYVLLPHGVRLLLTPRRGADLAPMMQRLGRRFVELHNRRHRTVGSPWAGRYKTGVLQKSPYLLAAMRHLELQPVWSGLATTPEAWQGSSFAHHAGSAFDPLVTDHPLFWELGNTPFERQLAYRRYCLTGSDNDEAGLRIDEATAKGWALGDADFIEQMSLQQARRLLPGQRGRPKLIRSL